MMTIRPARHVLTIDLEEHFHAWRFDSPMRRRHWLSYQSRIQSNVDRLLELLARHSARATFFSLGWLAERHPAVIRAISSAGHEIACLGYAHHLVAAQTPALFREDIRRGKTVLEDLIGRPVAGFRAPSFSIITDTPWALPVVEEEGFLYDSSMIPAADLLRSRTAGQWVHQLSNTKGLWEVPPTSLGLGGFRIPIGGGGYLRALHYPVLKHLLARIEALDQPIVMYLRCWEIDPEQPRMRGSALAELRHYLNLDKTESRLTQLLDDFQFGSVCEVIGPLREHCRPLNAPSSHALSTREGDTPRPLLATA